MITAEPQTRDLVMPPIIESDLERVPLTGIGPAGEEPTFQPGPRRRILLITYEYPPAFTPQSKRWQNLLKALVTEDPSLHFTVLTTSLGPGYSQAHFSSLTPPERIAGVDILRVNPGPMSSRLYEQPAFATAASPPRPAGLCRRSAQWLFHRSIRKLLPLDKSFEWFLCEYRDVVKSLSSQVFDAIITSGPPHSTHLWGWALSKVRKKPWIIDAGDPLSFASDNETLPISRLVQEFLEFEAISQASRLVVTTEETRSIYRRRFPAIADKVVVVPQGVALDTYQNIERSPIPGELVYAGTFYKHIREPYHLLEAVRSLHGKWRLTVLGALKPDVKAFLDHHRDLYSSCVTFLGHQSEEVCLRHFGHAQCLIFMSNKASTQVPGKLYECLATGLPILAILHDQGSDVTLPILRKFNQVTICGNTAQEIAAALERLSSLPPRTPSVDNPNLRTFAWQSRAAQYVQVLLSELLPSV